MQRVLFYLASILVLVSPTVAEIAPKDKMCSETKPCEHGAFCSYPVGSCGKDGKTGSCLWRPEICTMIYSPVCGCDGTTYPSDCAANAKGVSVKSAGECPKEDSKGNS
ncbi:MAG: Kazal-type serine protease inhibitor family protein [Bdellovibrionota bacterium]